MSNTINFDLFITLIILGIIFSIPCSSIFCECLGDILPTKVKEFFIFFIDFICSCGQNYIELRKKYTKKKNLVDCNKLSEECPICLESFESNIIVENIINNILNKSIDIKYNTNANIIELNCGHCFHKKCIDEWYCSNDECPICRSDIKYNITYL